MAKEWTQDERETASDMVIDFLDASPANKSWSRSEVDTEKMYDLQCELNEARELLQPYLDTGSTNAVAVREWLARNAPAKDGE